MTEHDKRADRDSMRHPEQRDSSLASTHEDATLAEQVLGDSPHPEARRWIQARPAEEDHRRS